MRLSDSDLQAQVAAAKAYEEFFVPALFGEWATRVAAVAKIQTGNHVLDVACGTRVLAREAMCRVAPSGFPAAPDARPGTLAASARVAPRSNGAKEQRRLFLTRISVSTPWSASLV